MKAKGLKFIENMANNRFKDKINVYKNNCILLENKDKLQGLKVDFAKIEENNKRLKDYIMTTLDLKTEDDFRKVVK